MVEYDMGGGSLRYFTEVVGFSSLSVSLSLSVSKEKWDVDVSDEAGR